MNKLFLFDIDNTMIDLTSSHLKAYKKSYLEVLGIKIPSKVIEKNFGKASNQFYISIFKEMNEKYDKEKAKKIRDIWEKEISKYLIKNKVKILPGVIEFLSYLKKEKYILGVVTGNNKKIGTLILKKSNLLKFFKIKSFSDRALNRSGIVKNAITLSKIKYNFNKVIVIGDSISDIKAAEDNKTFSVGVLTGFSSKEQLENAGADIILSSLKDYRKIIEKVV